MDAAFDLPPASARDMRRAVAAQQRGDYPTAERLYGELTRRHPDFPDAWHYHGLALHQQGRGDQALALLQRARELAPDNPGFLLNMGRVLREQGRLPDSIACLAQARTLAPDRPQPLIEWTLSLLTANRGAEALPEIERQLARTPGIWRLWLLLGDCREQGGDHSGALQAFDEAVRFAPPGEEGPSLRRAEAARRRNDVAAAGADLRAALAICPNSVGARLGLADLAAQAGDFAAVETLAREALALDPQVYLAWFLLATTRRIEPGDGLVEELERAARRAGDNPAAAPLHFARGLVWERLGDYDRAFAAYEFGNRLYAGTSRRYSREAQVAYTRGILTHLDERFAARAGRVGQPSQPGVIFVCGMLRSGTTLVESILASHPRVAAGGEMRYIHDRLRRTLGVQGGRDAGGWLSRTSDETLAEIARDWRQSLVAPAAGLPLVTDKMPDNSALMGLLHVCFPAAPIVLVSRDARDTCFSCYATPFEEGHTFPYALDSIGHYYRLYEALVAHWRRVLGPERLIEVEYEKLVADPEPEIRRLVTAVGLDWDPRCLAFHENRRRVATASLYQVRQPLYSSSVGRWRHFERHLGPLFAELEGPAPL